MWTLVWASIETPSANVVLHSTHLAANVWSCGSNFWGRENTRQKKLAAQLPLVAYQSAQGAALGGESDVLDRQAQHTACGRRLPETET